MNTNRMTAWVAGMWVAGCCAGAEAQVNSWANVSSGTTFKWEDGSNWSLLSPPSAAQTVFITNAATSIPNFRNRTVNIDGVTSGFLTTMTVSNLTLSAPGSAILGSHNLLLLQNTTTSFRVLNEVDIGNNGILSITNAVLYVEKANPTSLAEVYNDGHVTLDNGGLILSLNAGFYVGYAGLGQMIMSGGIWEAYEVSLGSGMGSEGFLTQSGGTLQAIVGELIGGFGQGTLTITGGTNRSPDLMVGGEEPGTGLVVLSGGRLETSEAYVGTFAGGSVVVSNGTWQAGAVFVGAFNDAGVGIGHGTLTLAGGTTTVLTNLYLTLDPSTTGTVWVVGGQLITTNASVWIGYGNAAAAQMTVSNGTWQAGSVRVGVANSDATLTLAGGMTTMRDLSIGNTTNSPATVLVRGGSTTVSSNLVIGDCAAGVTGELHVDAGTLYVTNPTHTATLNVSSGTFWLSGMGSVVADVLILTNPCSQFLRSGGQLTYRNAILDPNGDVDGDYLPNGWEQAHGLDPFNGLGDEGAFGDPDGDGYDNYAEFLAGSDPRNPWSTPLQIVAPPFQFTSIARSNNNVVLVWETLGGSTNQLQATSLLSPGAFTDLGPPLVISGSGPASTNYTDPGGATNPARFYRLRLVP